MVKIVTPIVLVAGLVLIVLYSCLVVSSRESRREEKENQEDE